MANQQGVATPCSDAKHLMVEEEIEAELGGNDE